MAVMLRITSSSSSKVFRYAVGAISSCRSITSTFNGRDAIKMQTDDCKPLKIPKSEGMPAKSKKFEDDPNDGGFPNFPKSFCFVFDDHPCDGGDIILNRCAPPEKRKRHRFARVKIDFQAKINYHRERTTVIAHYNEGLMTTSPTLALTVTVSRKIDYRIDHWYEETEFKVLASAHEIKVTSVLIKMPIIEYSLWSALGKPGEDVTLDNSGPYPVEEEGDLQNELREFLRIRGINKSNCEFLHKYMLHKVKLKKEIRERPIPEEELEWLRGFIAD